MPPDSPVACSLSANDLRTRLAEMTALGAAALVDARRHGTRAELRFAADAGVRGRVDAIVAAESQCCPFLAMRVTEAPGLIVLVVEAQAGAEVVLRELVDAWDRRP